MVETWRLLDTEYRDDPFMNMSVEEAIPRAVGDGTAPNTVRFWHNSNTIVLGCFQSADLEVNYDACRETGTQVVRRFTGGGAVYHDAGNLNYAISLKKGHPLVPDNDLQLIFQRLSEGTVEGLRSLGVRAEFQPPWLCLGCFGLGYSREGVERAPGQAGRPACRERPEAGDDCP